MYCFGLACEERGADEMLIQKEKAFSAGSGITEGVIWKQLLSFFFPILLGTFFQQMYNTADAIIVGKFVGKEALAAVGGTTTLLTLTLGFFIGLSSGGTVILSQFYGAHSSENASRTVHTAIAIAIYSGLALMVLGIATARVILRWMQTPEEVLDLAVLYTRIYFCGMIPSLVYNIGSGLLRAVGDSRRPLFFLIFACTANIVLDVILVLGLEMGVAGAALASALSQLFSAILVLLTLARQAPPLKLYLRRIRIHADLLTRMVRIGLPAGLQSVLHSLSNMIIQAAINSFGTNILAAYTAYGKIDAIYWAIISAFGVSITTFVGQNFGAAKYDRVRKSVRVCLLMACGTTLLISAVLLLLGHPLFLLFTNEEPVIEQGMAMLRFLVPTFITYVGLEIFAGAMRGAGEAMLPMIITLLGVCVLRVIWVLVIAPLKPDSFLFMLACYPITWILTSLAFTIYYYSYKWLERCKRRLNVL